MVVRHGKGSHAPLVTYWQEDNGEFDRMPVNWPLNGRLGDESPDAWEPLMAWPGGQPPEE